MSWDAVQEVAGAVLLLLGAALCLTAALGLVRFPDIMSRMHAATKPQSLGLLFVLGGMALSLRDTRLLGLLILIAVLQLLTVPVAAHLVGRAAFRTNQLRTDLTDPDELADDLARAGFHRGSGTGDRQTDDQTDDHTPE